MKKTSLFLFFFLMGFPTLLQGSIISNSGFESTADWNLTEYDTNGTLGGEFSNEWSSEGSMSFRFYRGTGDVYAGTWFQIAQSGVDLTGVTSLMFDCRDTGIDIVPLQFIVDGVTQVGSWSNNGWPGGQGTGWGNTATTYDIEIPLSSTFSGAHELAIRLYQPLTHNPADPKIYRIDNLRLVPEPSPILALMLCLAAASFWKRNKSDMLV
jgi:hypothetical protein